MSGRPDFDDPAPDLEPSPQEEPLDLPGEGQPSSPLEPDDKRDLQNEHAIIKPPKGGLI